MSLEEKNISINTKGENFRQQLIFDINNSQLPIGMVYFIAKDIFIEVEKTYYATLNSEAPEYQENKIKKGESLTDNE